MIKKLKKLFLIICLAVLVSKNVYTPILVNVSIPECATKVG